MDQLYSIHNIISSYIASLQKASEYIKSTFPLYVSTISMNASMILSLLSES